MDNSNQCLNCFSEKTGDGACPHCGYVPGTDSEEHYYLPKGTLLHNKYLVGTVLGHGGFGITYAGFDTMLDVKVAVKEYLPSDISTRALGETTVTSFSGEKRAQFEYGLKKFREEAKTLAKFNNHPCVVSITDFFNENNTAYLVMEYLDGTTLSEYLREHGGKLSWEDAIRLLAPVFDALEVVHEAGLIHRDISPDNIFITSQGKTKLLDFGTARLAMGEKSKSLSVILKPGYAPPEQYFSRGKQGPWTDIYSLAATLYKLIAGETPLEAVERQLDEGERLEQALDISIPESFRDALLKALSLKPAQRQQNIRQLRESLFVTDEPAPQREIQPQKEVSQKPNETVFGEQKQEKEKHEKRQSERAVNKQESPKAKWKKRKAGIIAVAVAVSTVIFIVAVSNTNLDQTIFSEPEQTVSSESVRFVDENLEAAVREELGVQGEITKKDLRSITELDVNGTSLKHIAGIEYMENLEVLSLDENEISDISALSGLTNLSTLSLIGNNINDISALSHLANINKLDLGSNEISDISAFSGLANLEYLSLPGNNISEFNALAGLTNLETLDLSNNKISDLSALSGLTNLVTLNLGSNEINDISAFTSLTNLEYLSLPGNNISDISALAGLTNLRDLSLFGNDISDIGVFAGLTSLVTLNLSRNNISDINSLAGLINLEELKLRYTSIREVSALAGLTNLKKLFLPCDNVHIIDASPLDGLTNCDISY